MTTSTKPRPHLESRDTHARDARTRRTPGPQLAAFGVTLLLGLTACDDPGPVGSGDPAPALIMTRIGAPAWEPVDFHRFSADVGEGYSRSLDPLLALLPSPNHGFHPAFGVGPGEAHTGPYQQELGDAALALEWTERSVFTQEEITLPNSAYAVWMLVPSAGAATGSSPDFISGPILPHALFPLHVDFQAYSDGVAVEGDHVAFDIPALDMVDPPFAVDGHSHIPLFLAEDLGSLPATTGRHEWRGSVVDAAGHGWKLSTQFEIVE